MDRRWLLRAGLAASTAALGGCGTLGRPDDRHTETDQRPVGLLSVRSSVGLVTDADGDDELGAVRLQVHPHPESEPIDLAAVQLQWVDSTGTYDLVHERVFEGDADGAFACCPKDPASATATEHKQSVLSGPNDRALVYIDIGRSDSAPGGDSAVADAYATTLTDSAVIRDRALQWGETVTLRLETASGSIVERRLVVPETCSCVPPVHI